LARICADRARALVGTPFRPQGRDPARGLDCVGLCLVVYNLLPAVVRSDYRLRGNHRPELEAAIGQWFRRVPRQKQRAGDLLLLTPADDQLHLAVRTEAGFVHADARLKRVVETPGDPGWPLVAVFRRKRKVA
jgi:cell wall-associated NlpC family hydrolase